MSVNIIQRPLLNSSQTSGKCRNWLFQYLFYNEYLNLFKISQFTLAIIDQDYGRKPNESSSVPLAFEKCENTGYNLIYNVNELDSKEFYP